MSAHKYIIHKELGIALTPALGSIQSTIYKDEGSKFFWRVDIVHNKQRADGEIFSSLMYLCTPDGVRLNRFPEMKGYNLTAEELFQSYDMTRLSHEIIGD